MKNVNSILVVDDDNDIRHLFSLCLRGAGYNVLEAVNGRECLQLVRTRLPDLVLLDVRLPDLNGVDVCRQIKTDPALKDVFVALCSGEATTDENKVDGFHTGADEYLVKPFGVQELLARVQTLMRLRNTTAALRASEEHHRRLIDILPDAVCLIHPDGRLLAVNSQAVAMLGCDDSEELLKKSLFEITPPEEHERVRHGIAHVLKNGIIRDVEYTMIKKNGTRLQVELSATASLGVNIEPAGLLISVVRDITERKHIQQALTASEERFRQMANHIQQVFWMSSVDKGEIFYVSPAYEEIWGRSVASLYESPTSWFESVHAEDRNLIEERARMRQTCGEYNEVYRVVRPDGTVRWVQDRAFPVRDGNGVIYRIAGVAEDITRRKQAWDALGEGEARKRAIMEAAADAIITIDHKGSIVELNPAAGKMFGHHRTKLVGKNILELVPLSLRPWVETGLAHSFTGEKGPALGSRIEFPVLRADGSQFFAELTISKIRLPGSPMFTLYVHDITRRKRTEAELRSLSQRIIQAQEAERSRIAQELHDGVNQMVASVKMRLHKVQSSLPDLKPAASEILSRCNRLLMKVLEENRRIAHNLRPTDLDNLGLAAACSSFLNDCQLRTNLKFNCRISTQTVRLPLETELHLFRIVQEAVNNIEKHSKAKTVDLQIRFRGDAAILKIHDDGRGFNIKSPDEGKKKRPRLGLTNMRERALSLGGTCDISSTPGNGTTIIVRVPLSDAANENSAADGKPRPTKAPASLESEPVEETVD